MLTVQCGFDADAPSGPSAFVYKSRARNEPTTVTMPQWAAAMWLRLESLVADLGTICVKVRPDLLVMSAHC